MKSSINSSELLRLSGESKRIYDHHAYDQYLLEPIDHVEVVYKFILKKRVVLVNKEALLSAISNKFRPIGTLDVQDNGTHIISISYTTDSCLEYGNQEFIDALSKIVNSECLNFLS